MYSLVKNLEFQGRYCHKTGLVGGPWAASTFMSCINSNNNYFGHDFQKDFFEKNFFFLICVFSDVNFIIGWFLFSGEESGI